MRPVHQNRLRLEPKMSTSSTLVVASHTHSPQTTLIEVEHHVAELEQKLHASQAKTRRLAEEQAQMEHKKRSLKHYIEQHPMAAVEVQPPAKQQ